MRRRAWKDGVLAKPSELEAPADSAPRDRDLTKAQARKLVVSDYVVEYAGGPVPKGLRWSFKRLCRSLRSRRGWRWRGCPSTGAADYPATDPRTLRKVYRKFDPSYLRNVADALAL